MKKNLLLAAAALCAALVLPALPTAAQAQTSVKVVMHAPLRVLDPIFTNAYVTRNHGYLVFDTLFSLDNEGKPQPQMVDSYKLSADKLTYTFKLRADGKWSDGEPVKASDFVFSFKRLMDPKNAAEYAYLQYPIKNAEGINTGKITDIEQLGVKAVDDRTLEITLERPTPYFLGALTHYTAFPLPEHLIKAKGDAWVQVANIVTNGPYKPTEWIPGSHVTTVKNPEWYGTKDLKIDGVKFFTLEDQAAALRRFRAGEFDVITAFPTDQYQWLEENMPGQAHVAPFAGLYYYVVNSTKPPFNDVKVRQALSMAINREVIGPQILGTGELPAYGWVPPGMANYEGADQRVDWADLPYGEKLEKAKALLTEAGYGPDKPLTMQLRYNTDENHKRLAVAIASMWKPLGVSVELMNTEVKVHYADLRQGGFDVGRAGWLADYNDADNFLNLLKTGVEMNYGKWSSPDFDKLLNEANASTDMAARAKLMKQAEKIALDQSAAIPIYFYASRSVVSPKITGYEDNAFDKHRTRWLIKAE